MQLNQPRRRDFIGLIGSAAAAFPLERPVTLLAS
jgi:hypothetical protein